MSLKVANNKKKNAQQLLLRDTAIKAISDKQGNEIISLDLREITDDISDHFIVCDASSTTQVKAIADNVMKQVKEATGENPWHKEGFENLEWILLDYVDVVVHIFQTEKREFYQIEDLWSDAKKERFE